MIQEVDGDSRRRLGFAVKIVGRPDLKSNDARRWQGNPHLRVSVGYLDRIFDYLAEHDVRMYRISSDIAPYVTHPDLPRFHGQIDECRAELAALGARARALDLRLSMHPAQYIVLNSPTERVAEASIRDFVAHARFLDALDVDLDAKIVTHTGGVYGDRVAAAKRFVRRYEALPLSVRRRLVLENDEVSWAVEDVLSIHERTGIPLVFDNLHHAVNDPSGMGFLEALRRCLATWPAGQTPKSPIDAGGRGVHHSGAHRESDFIGAQPVHATGDPPMDGQRFDSLMRQAALHRRGFLHGLAAVVGLGLTRLGGDGAEAACRRICRRRNGRTVCRRVCTPIVQPGCGPGLTSCAVTIPPICRRVCRRVGNRRVCRVRCSSGGSSTICRNLQTDFAHCGRCDAACPAGTTGCRGGRCCQLDDTACPATCLPGIACAGCCTGFCRFEGLCGALQACRADGEGCPGGCIANRECRSCCHGYCGSGTRCCIQTGDPCPTTCESNSDCAACCDGICNTDGFCGTPV